VSKLGFGPSQKEWMKIAFIIAPTKEEQYDSLVQNSEGAVHYSYQN